MDRTITTCKDRNRVKRFVVASIVLVCGLTAQAAEAPLPPCGSSLAYPPFAEPGAPPNIRVWRGDDLVSGWIPPACTGWAPADGLLVALAGQFRFEGGAEGLLTRFGAISTLQGIRYWSVSDHRVAHAYRARTRSGQPRPKSAKARLYSCRDEEGARSLLCVR